MDIKGIYGKVMFGAKIKQIPTMTNITSNEVPLKNLKLNGLTALIGADVYTPQNTIARHDLLFKDSKLFAIDDFNPSEVTQDVKYVFLKDKTITPAILDEHIHGGYGINFHTSDEASIRKLLVKLGKSGTGAVVATTLPGYRDDICSQIKILNNIIESPDAGSAKILGIHLEGPFLNPEKRGIHPTDKLMIPSVKNYKSLEPENVKIVTLAPELDEGYKLSKYLAKNGVIVSAGHSIASARDILHAGIKQVTHILNAMTGLHQRNHTISTEGLLNNEITAEMNSDKSLLSPQIMNMIMNEKPEDKLVLISDALPEAGIKKDFDMNGVRIHVKKDWTAVSDDGILAGSMQFLHGVAKNIINATNMTFKDFIRYSSINPASNLGVKDMFELKKGNNPIFTIWDNKTLKTEKTFIN